MFSTSSSMLGKMPDCRRKFLTERLLFFLLWDSSVSIVTDYQQENLKKQNNIHLFIFIALSQT